MMIDLYYMKNYRKVEIYTKQGVSFIFYFIEGTTKTQLAFSFAKEM